MELREIVIDTDHLQVLALTGVTYVSGHQQLVESVQAWSIRLPFGPDAKSEIVGPLFTSNATRSYGAFHGGAVLGQTDVRAHDDTPRVHLGSDGSVVRLTEHGDIDRLERANGQLRWSRLPDRVSVGQPGDDESRLRTFDGQVLVQAETDRQVRCYEGRTGQSRPIDSWISEVVTDLVGRRDLCNRRTLLSDDLRVVAVLPFEACQRDDGSVIKEFALDGKMYDRSSYGVCYRRPSRKPEAIAVGEELTDAAGIYVINDTALFFVVTNTAMRLEGATGKTVREVARPPEWGMAVGRPIAVRHDAQAKELVVVAIASWRKPGSEHTDITLEVVRWQYEGAGTSRQVLAVSRLFTEDSGRFIPMDARDIEGH